MEVELHFFLFSVQADAIGAFAFGFPGQLKLVRLPIDDLAPFDVNKAVELGFGIGRSVTPRMCHMPSAYQRASLGALPSP